MHSFNSCLMHCVFSVKGRASLLTPAIRERLWPYLDSVLSSGNKHWSGFAGEKRRA